MLCCERRQGWWCYSRHNDILNWKPKRYYTLFYYAHTFKVYIVVWVPWSNKAQGMQAYAHISHITHHSSTRLRNQPHAQPRTLSSFLRRAGGLFFTVREVSDAVDADLLWLHYVPIVWRDCLPFSAYQWLTSDLVFWQLFLSCFYIKKAMDAIFVMAKTLFLFEIYVASSIIERICFDRAPVPD